MSNTLKKRVTISLDQALYARLDKRNRSGAIENIIKLHYQKESIDALYTMIKQRLIKEGLISDGTISFNDLPPARAYQACCGRYPDLDCGHWYRLPDSDFIKNKKTGEEKEMG